MGSALLTRLHWTQGAMGCHQKAPGNSGTDSRAVRMLTRYCSPGKGVQASGKVGTSATLKARLTPGQPELLLWAPLQTWTLVPGGCRKAQVLGMVVQGQPQPLLWRKT